MSLFQSSRPHIRRLIFSWPWVYSHKPQLLNECWKEELERIKDICFKSSLTKVLRNLITCINADVGVNDDQENEKGNKWASHKILHIETEATSNNTCTQICCKDWQWICIGWSAASFPVCNSFLQTDRNDLEVLFQYELCSYSPDLFDQSLFMR